MSRHVDGRSSSGPPRSKEGAMESAVVKNPAEPKSSGTKSPGTQASGTQASGTRAVDPVWTRIREAAQQAAASEPVLAGILHATILSQPRFESALSYHLARLVGTTELPAALI